MGKLLELWSDLSKETQRQFVSISILIAGLTILFIGMFLFPSHFAAPFLILGIFCTIVGAFALAVCLADWWG